MNYYVTTEEKYIYGITISSSYECRKAALLPVSIIKQNNKVLKAVTWKYEENLQCIIRVVFDSPLRCSLC